MDILYVSSTCSREKYAEYIESNGARVSQQAQKYNLLLAEGLAEAGSNVTLFSSRPINRQVSKRVWFKKEKEYTNGVCFCYVPFFNLPVLRNLFVFFGVFFGVLFYRRKEKQSVVICDALNIVASFAAIFAATIRGFTTVGIVTDVPCHLSDMKKIPVHQRINLWLMRRFKSYLLLTEPMSDIVNPKGRPYIVLEGHADVSMDQVDNTLEGKYEKKVCIYAGSLKTVYGIKNLVEGFILADVPDSELWIYGNGDYVEELKVLVEKHPSVKYLGIVPNQTIVAEELKATLLINPRPTDQEYTRYSFPSKNMEYMASGTPVLTTRLPGMPKDHEQYVYLIDDESAAGIKESLTDALSKSREELHLFGQKAKKFIIENKNNVVQSKKVIDFLTKII